MTAGSNMCSYVQIESLEEKQLPARSLKIMAEAFAIKGLCYEKLPLQVQKPFQVYFAFECEIFYVLLIYSRSAMVTLLLSLVWARWVSS